MSSIIPPSRLGPREIFRNAYMILRHDAGRKLVILTRTSVSYVSIEAMQDAFSKMEEATAYISRPRTTLLIDSRQAPARNDPAFEAEFGRLRKLFLRDFQKIATVVSTAVGILQASRHVRVDEMPVGIFNEPGEALAYLGVTLDPARVGVQE
jgi:hypothetical protein